MTFALALCLVVTGPTVAIAAKPLPSASGTQASGLSRLLQADVLLITRKSLPAGLVRRLRHVRGVVAAVPVVAGRGMAVSYTMGHQDRLALTKPVRVDGARSMKLPIAGFGTVGIGGVDAV